MQLNNDNTMVRSIAGFTLIELVTVIVILGVLSLVAVRSFTSRADTQRFDASITEMESLKNAIVGDPDQIQDGIRVDFGYVGDTGILPASLAELVSNVSSVPGWNGPYIAVNFQEDPTDYLNDAYGSAYVYSSANLTIYSPGADVTINIASSSAILLNNTVNVVIQDRNGFSPSVGDSVNISVFITLQSGGTIPAVITSNVGATGTATLTGVHIGNHIVQATHALLAGETPTKTLSINPDGAITIKELFFSNLPE